LAIKEHQITAPAQLSKLPLAPRAAPLGERDPLVQEADSQYRQLREVAMNDISKTSLGGVLRSSAKLDPQVLYRQLGQLRNKMPTVSDLAKLESSVWIGQVLVVVETVWDATIDAAKLRVHFDGIAT
jgi:hypothetical protein